MAARVISEAEAAKYDRQIRLWGLDAQKRLQASTVLVVGMCGLGAEVCKNIALAGIKQLTVMDNRCVTGEEYGAKFLLLPSDIGKNRAEACVSRLKELNPMVEILSDVDSVDEKQDSYFAQYDVVCLTGCIPHIMKRVSRICHHHGVKFFCGDTWGYFGYFFTDFGSHPHQYVEEETKKEESTLVKKEISFVSLTTALNFDLTKYKNVKRLPTLYFVLQVFLSFFESFGRYPYTTSHDDTERLMSVKEDLFDQWKLDQSILEDSFARLSQVEVIRWIIFSSTTV
ncbi:SUMO-activating enzyme subunit 1-like isoform X2 [Corticium candelabrum]|uniref:SUMO-activating enzyme subunit 1-like isoform X2 n=1 Tax=Corticium candelabrum TaxID=121492 RepID=UPI002E26CD6F|nr:SUMO-activating enzyme subunit 1-like isoform X2 [Corticium candelabrum]XP_062503210.1 SUMO-activating enzyme subunit 1-like isoform X2 [Corticium candelabrum]